MRCWNRDCRGLNVRKYILEDRFVEYLEELVPGPRLLELLDVIVEERWRARVEHQQSMRDKILKELDEAEDNQDQLTAEYVKGVIPKEVYQDHIASVRQRILEIRAKLAEPDLDQAEIRRITQRARTILRTPHELWQGVEGQQRSELQSALFPLGVMYWKNGLLRTPLSPKGYSLLRLSQEGDAKMATFLSKSSNSFITWLEGVARLSDLL